MSERSQELHEFIQELPHKLTAYIVRHGKTDYEERNHVAETGNWNPDMDDLTQDGKAGLRRTAAKIANDLDPTKHIIIFFSSPRARALRSQEEIANYLQQQGFEIGGMNVVETLRSGGDKSPLVGQDNSLEFLEGESQENYNINTEDAGAKTTGARFKKMLAYFAAVDKQQLWKKIQEPNSNLHNKIPVFIAVTHGENVHAGSNTDEEYGSSFLGKLNKEHSEHVKLKRGKMLKLEFDLNNPGKAQAFVGRRISLSGKPEVIDFVIDQHSGNIEKLTKE